MLDPNTDDDQTAVKVKTIEKTCSFVRLNIEAGWIRNPRKDERC